MTYGTLRHRFRQRLGELTARFDWLEGLLFVLGIVLIGVAVVCGVALVLLLVHLTDPEYGFGPSHGFGTAGKVIGSLFFLALGAATLAAGWDLAGRRVWARIRPRRRTHDRS